MGWRDGSGEGTPGEGRVSVSQSLTASLDVDARSCWAGGGAGGDSRCGWAAELGDDVSRARFMASLSLLIASDPDGVGPTAACEDDG